MGILAKIFAWWDESSFAMWFYTKRAGNKVGEDAQGNIYYQNGKRRWVIYNGEAEGSRVPPEWHGWLHHTWEEPPTERPLVRREWELPHQPNLTGTPLAYHPPGSLYNGAPQVEGKYEAWQPE
ncbi:NADH:ubiquinone oxidoreductase subunit NDUFA12 [Paracoccaceae bacterium GXU_MW_L88]